MSLAPLRFAVILLSVWLVLATVTLLPGVFRVTGHEMDLIQMLDVIYRMQAGDLLHHQIMTPLGLLAFLPIKAGMDLGYGPGRSYLLAQAGVAALLLPAIWYLCLSRFEGVWRLAVGVALLVITMALVYGGPQPSILASMYYNRWAWVLTALIVFLLFLPARPGWRADGIDGVLIGLAGAALILIKMTYVVALVPFVLMVILQERRGRLFLGALLGAGVVLGAVSAGMGLDFWRAYLLDLLQVSASALRRYPGEEFSGLVSSPAALPQTLLLLGSIVVWRKAGMMRAGLYLLLLGPGLLYITYQNWGNDPKWLGILGVLLLCLRPEQGARPVWGVPARQLTAVMGGAALLLFAPSAINMATSPVRHMSQTAEEFSPIFSDLAKADAQVLTSVAYLPRANVTLDGFEIPAALRGEDYEPEAPVMFLGEALPECSVRLGLVGWIRQITAQLGAVEEAVGKPVLSADIHDMLWLFGPFERLPEMAPWYYGTDDGFEAADYVMVPFCPLNTPSRARKLEVIEDLGWQLEEVIRTDLFILARRTG
ncbi:hypothetical protein [Oceanibium sediminis]|uniref:hypothetical protein n=1 Tax=Oceanibium sediminis TaxID=2026339 RepID=UPI000DD3FF6F|nr:hypothetical protein [Oceanibium sediminis]